MKSQSQRKTSKSTGKSSKPIQKNSRNRPKALEEIGVKCPARKLPGVKAMLHGLAWELVKTTPVTYEDALSECYWLYMKACRLWNPNKGMKFSTWVCFVVKLNLKTMLKNRMKHNPLIFVEEVKESLLGPAPELESTTHSKALVWEERLGVRKYLSPDARELLALILETPAELVDWSVQTPQALVQRIVCHLERARGWQSTRIQWAYKELEMRVRETYC